MSPLVNELPAELLELIIDQIPLSSPQGRKTLCTCLLVSKIFFLRSRSRLFYHVDLYPDDDRTSRTTALRILLESEVDENNGYPSLGRCIKSLEVIWPPSAFHSTSVDISHEEFRKHLSFDIDDVAAILSVLARTRLVQTFSLYFADTTGFSNFQSITPIWNAVDGICHSPTLESLNLEHLWGVPHDVFDIRTIKNLSLSNVTSSDELDFVRNAENDGGTLPPSQLRCFTYTFRCPFSSRWLQTLSPFSYLHTLVVKFDSVLPDNPNSQFDTLLMLCSGTLESLSISLDSATPVFKLYPHLLQRLTVLRALKFTVHSNSPPVFGAQHDYEPSTSFTRTHDVVESLETLQSVPNSLQSIGVDFRARLEVEYGAGFRSDHDWQKLGDKLIESRYSLVQKITVALLVNASMSGEKPYSQAPLFNIFSKRWEARYPTIPIKVVEIAAN
ncbi:hypothetical protein CPB83DRAFT_841568 [Crepidotus variabilis]|uniref:F-box domain-containing protein n=1 Tax=Crepidotus variabilis TaxID=179855 RepID=A0A9P6ETU8_9AGAR|nr:hypothetical protein CPB83DRAFT_841568 [Crepidotus variabilis]